MSELSLNVKGRVEEVVRKLNLLLADLLPEIYVYNNKIKHTGYYLKPVHIVVKTKSNGEKIKYYYYGRYWYRLEKANGNKIKWIYIGKSKPSPELPDPPENPLEGLVLKIAGDEVIITASRRELLELVNSALLSRIKASMTN